MFTEFCSYHHKLELYIKEEIFDRKENLKRPSLSEKHRFTDMQKIG